MRDELDCVCPCGAYVHASSDALTLDVILNTTLALLPPALTPLPTKSPNHDPTPIAKPCHHRPRPAPQGSAMTDAPHLVQGGDRMRQAEPVQSRVRKPGAVHAGYHAIHDDRPGRRERLVQTGAALRGHAVDLEQGGAASICAAGWCRG